MKVKNSACMAFSGCTTAPSWRAFSAAIRPISSTSQ
jgi:hypothetical protein